MRRCASGTHCWYGAWLVHEEPSEEVGRVGAGGEDDMSATHSGTLGGPVQPKATARDFGVGRATHTSASARCFAISAFSTRSLASILIVSSSKSSL